MQNEKITVVIPVFKLEDYLDKCVSGVVGQSYKNLEIILVDDGSPDNCPKMCDDWALKDDRIKVIHKENDGLAEARNTGIKAATGDYIMYIDGDDWIEPDMIELLYNTLIQNDAQMSRCGIYLDYEDGTETQILQNNELSVPEKDNQISDLVTGGHLSGVVWNKLYKFSAVKDIMFDKADGCSEDIMYNFRVLSAIDKVAYNDIPKYHYIIRNNSITNSEFNENAFSIVRAKSIILESQRDNKNTLPFCIKGYVQSAFIVLSGIITHNKCTDRYDELRNSILIHKKEILSSGLYSKLDKIKTIILSISPRLYNKLIIKLK